MKLSTSKIEDIYYSEVLYPFVELGYRYTLSPGLNIKLYRKDSTMPEITVKTSIDNDYYIYTPSLEFPALSYADDNGNGEYVSWLIDEWSKVGRACENLYLFSFNENDYIDE